MPICGKSISVLSIFFSGSCEVPLRMKRIVLQCNPSYSAEYVRKGGKFLAGKKIKVYFQMPTP